MKKIVLFLSLFFLLPSVSLAAPFTVSQGGTGKSTLKDGGVLVGNGIDPVTVTYSPSFDHLSATNTDATSTFQGNVRLFGNVKLGTISGIVSAVNGYLGALNLQAPLTFTDDTLGLSLSGTNGQVQFNSGGVFSGSNDFIWDSTNKILKITEGVALNGITLNADGLSTPREIKIADQTNINVEANPLEILGGKGYGTGGGTNIVIKSGDADPAGAGYGGPINLHVGKSSGGLPGNDMNFFLGTSDTGPLGRLVVYTTPEQGVVFDFSHITSGGHTLTIPDKSGTLATLDDISGGGSGAPGGSDGQIQFNNSGSFGGADLFWDASNHWIHTTNGIDTGSGDPLNVSSGVGGPDGGNAGIATFAGGNAFHGDGGLIQIVGGSTVTEGSGNGGNVALIPGQGAGGGVAGKILFKNFSGPAVFFGIEGLTGNRTQNFPDKDGTFAMLDDIPSNVVTSTVVADAAGAALGTSDSGKIFTNEGAMSETIFTLPSAVAGLHYTFVVQNNSGVQIVAQSGNTLSVAGSVSASGGNVDSTTPGTSVTFVAINGSEWVATSVVGSWDVH